MLFRDARGSGKPSPSPALDYLTLRVGNRRAVRRKAVRPPQLARLRTLWNIRSLPPLPPMVLIILTGLIGLGALAATLFGMHLADGFSDKRRRRQIAK
jgi:hypothetical protein